MKKNAPESLDLSYEQAQEELEKIIARLESGQPVLEESIALFERGQQLIQYCSAKLEQAELKLKTLLPQGPEESGS